MYSDQIFCLLGHNGAGKTSTISMLSGLFGATEGEASVFGVDMFNETDRVRQFMGVCPQHDVLFDLLTPEEHLDIFFDFKGADPKNKKAEIAKLMKDVGVDDKSKNMAYQLSGGNKRKLSVAIALVGGSKFVLLDEPTSGLDLSARRQLWNMLKEYKKDRIVVLTTHYMDEADILGDRIGIMNEGKITVLGSSMFLKNRFGVGYNFTVLKKSPQKDEVIFNYLKENLGTDVTKLSEVQGEISFQIPNAYQAMFIDFFKNLDENLDNLNIRSYGISITTLEEVFLKIGGMQDPGKLLDASHNLKQSEVQSEGPKEETSDYSIKTGRTDFGFCSNLIAVLKKRFQIYSRNKKVIFNEMVLPALFMLIGVFIASRNVVFVSEGRVLEPSRLPLQQRILMNEEPVNMAGSDLSMNLFAENLPMAAESFDVTLRPYSEHGRMNYTEF